MLRALLVLLLLANAAWWAWTHGWLPAGALPLPLDTPGQREPQHARRLPFLIPLNAQSTWMQPAQDLYAALAELIASGAVKQMHAKQK